MKRSKLSYDEWKCIKSKKMRGKKVNNELLKGHIGLIEIEEVSEKQIWRFNDEDIIVCDKGLKWLSILPQNDFYCITAMMNEKCEILLWYIDMIAEQGLDVDGIPYFDDLYLDLVVYPDGTVMVDDMDELEEALFSKDITQEQFELAINTCDKLKTGLLSNVDTLIEYTLSCYDLLNAILLSTLNTRAILPDSLRFVRSDIPNCLTTKEMDWLIAHNITTIVDLRTDEERAQKECPLVSDDKFQYICMPVTGGNAIPQTVDDVADSYIKMVDGQMSKIIDVIWTAETNVLYFCNAGKDRTGVVSAILLYKSGMNMDYIIDDYMKSKDNLKDMLDSYGKSHPDVDIHIIIPHERYMREFMEWYKNRSREDRT